MTGQEWLEQLLKNKINECVALEQQASEVGDVSTQNTYNVAYFRLLDQFIRLKAIR